MESAEHKQPNKYLLVVGGATASGKTGFAIQLARHFGTEIVSADSRQFYREMQIGTAKPTVRELSAAPHHLIGHISIETPYSVGDYEQEALQLLDRLYQQYPIVILCGGSGLFIKALCEGLDQFPEVPPEITAELQQTYEQEGLEFLQSELLNADPEYYREVDRQNPRRLLRALSVIRTSGKPFSYYRKQSPKPRAFIPVYLQMDWPREELYARINRRVDLMLAGGLIEEARQLYDYRHLQALQTVGYQELFDYFSGLISLEEAVELIKRNSRRYAKRQLTWFRRDRFWQKFHPGDLQKALHYIGQKIEG